MAAAKPALPVTGDPEADRLLVEDPLAQPVGVDRRALIPLRDSYRGRISIWL
ncbi:MAG: hypothetical protein Q8K58_00140 [Acidimicrobiales bacterium]|nr:hypothetical protein [Acidimicrobiales bacterium]